jgi:hypothetical protein
MIILFLVEDSCVTRALKSGGGKFSVLAFEKVKSLAAQLTVAVLGIMIVLGKEFENR